MELRRDLRSITIFLSYHDLTCESPSHIIKCVSVREGPYTEEPEEPSLDPGLGKALRAFYENIRVELVEGLIYIEQADNTFYDEAWLCLQHK